MYYKLVSALLLAAAAARPAAALELACNTTTKLGAEALKYSRITHGPAGWTIVHTLSNGERRDRAQQYRIADLSAVTSLAWSGEQYDNPALVMRGDLRATTAGYYFYTEDLRDTKRYDLIIAQTQAMCWELSALEPAPTPPPASADTTTAPTSADTATVSGVADKTISAPAPSSPTTPSGTGTSLPAPTPLQTADELPQYKFAHGSGTAPTRAETPKAPLDYLCKPQPSTVPASAETATTSPDYLCKPQPATAPASTDPTTAPAGADTATAPATLVRFSMTGGRG